MKKKFFVLSLLLLTSVAQAQTGPWQLSETRGCVPFSPNTCVTDVFNLDSTGAWSHSNGGSGTLTPSELASLTSVVQPFLADALSAAPTAPVCQSFNGGPNRYSQAFSYNLRGLAPAPTASASPSPSPSTGPSNSLSGAVIHSQDAYAVCTQNANYNAGTALFTEVQTLNGAHPATGTSPSPSPSASASPSPSPTP